MIRKYWWMIRYAYRMWRLCRLNPSRRWQQDIEFSWSQAIAAFENNDDFLLTPKEALYEEISCWSD